MPSTDYARTRAALRCRNLLAQELRETRERARLGGEEFGILMETDGATAAARAEAFRRDLDTSPLQTESGDAPITVSIGCGAFDPARYADGDALYRDVDAALYRAKTGGRNRTESIAAPAL